ncbi:hypothetical protein CLOM_g7536 [Closterium sp. NIES-68]|nr:hypothetical protein CLOM_g7536 [Closterium sp. NIES-68]GJP80355.1 hypothetical protein CLOP_g10564 [Closterium sp. NIES-67]
MSPGEVPKGYIDPVIPEVWGRVHSIESFSAVDGPAIRSVVFVQGCLRRCVFCANPDTWSVTAKCQRLSSKDIAARLKKNLAYYEGGGGVTVSGGEPMMQPHFCSAVFKEAHRLGITTALDTAGYGRAKDWAEVLPHTDTVLLCTKAINPKLYFDMVQVKQQLFLDFAKAVGDYGVPMVIRFVLVPGMTDTKEEVEGLVEWAKQQPTLVGIEMLPYHRLGVNKWEALGLKYPLDGMVPNPKEVVDHWRSYIALQGLKVML